MSMCRVQLCGPGHLGNCLCQLRHLPPQRHGGNACLPGGHGSSPQMKEPQHNRWALHRQAAVSGECYVVKGGGDAAQH